MSDIGVAQDLDVNLRRQLAARQFYSIGKWFHFGGASLAVALALVAPVVLLFAPDLGPTLGAIAGVWIFASRLILEPRKQEQQRKGAVAQEMFDCVVAELEWNDALVRRLSEEEIRRASGSMERAPEVRGWYPAEADLGWPSSVLVCQRSNAVWGRRQHRAYGQLLAGVAVGWGVIGILVAVAHGASLAEYLTTIALPSLPAVLDASEVSRLHGQAADKRGHLEAQIDQMVRAGATTAHELREIQDQLFSLRRDAPLVPNWFYKLLKADYEADMRYAAQLASAQGSSSEQGRG
jgi:hypothetical protein